VRDYNHVWVFEFGVTSHQQGRDCLYPYRGLDDHVRLAKCLARLSLSLETTMDRAQKAVSIEELKSVFDESGAVVIAHYTGMTFVELADLRGRLRKEGGKLKVFKNRLAQKALDGKAGADAQALFKGQSVIAYAADPVTAAKVAAQYAKENDKFKIVGGIMDGAVLNEAGVKSLATLPSLDELRGRLIGLLQAPATKVAGVLQAPAGQLARVFGAYAKKDAA